MTHWERCRRHNFISIVLAKEIEQKQYTVYQEPSIWTSDGQRRKPDIIAIKGEEVVITDVQIVWEGPRPLAAAFANKSHYYSIPEFIEGCRRKWPGKEISILSIILGARGIWCKSNNLLLQKIGLPKKMIHGAIKGSITINAVFSHLVWRRR